MLPRRYERIANPVNKSRRYIMLIIVYLLLVVVPNYLISTPIIKRI